MLLEFPLESVVIKSNNTFNVLDVNQDLHFGYSGTEFKVINNSSIQQINDQTEVCIERKLRRIMRRH